MGRPQPEWSGDWELFELSWRLYLKSEGIPESERATLFREKTSDIPVIASSCPASGSFDEVMSVLRTRLRKSKENSTTLEKRFEFSKIVQEEGEPITYFLKRLEESADDCSFSRDPERVRDQFLFGIGDEAVRNLLLKENKDVTLDRVRKIAELCERVMCGDEDNDVYNDLILELNPVPTVPTRTRRAKAGCQRKILHEILSEELDRDSDEREAPDSPENQRILSPSPPNLTDQQEEGARRSLKRKSHNGGSQEERHFSCHYCDYSSQYRRSVIRHERIHTGEKPFMCEYCSKTFREKQSLDGHIRSIHTGEKPYVCEYCSKGFAKRVNLNDHVRTHTKQTPYLCEFCGKGFAQKSALNTHVMTHTGGKPFLCQTCGSGFRTSTLLKSHAREHGDALSKGGGAVPDGVVNS